MEQVRELGDILGDIQVRGAQWTRVEMRGSTGIQVPRGRQIAVHFVLEGHPLMSTKTQSNFPLRPGDAMIVLDRQSHFIRNRDGAHCQPFRPTPSPWLFSVTDTLRLTGPEASQSGEDATVLTGVIRARWPAELAQWRLLPPVLHGNRNFRSAAAGRESMAVFDQMTSRPGGSQVITRYAEFLIARELQQVLERSPGLLRVSASADLAIEQALAAIAQDPAMAWSVDSLARHVGMSRSMFAERFLRYAGATPMALVFQHRMELAAQYLKQQVMPIKEIAGLIGYGSVASFTRAFSGHFAASPAAYRKLALEAAGG